MENKNRDMIRQIHEELLEKIYIILWDKYSYELISQYHIELIISLVLKHIDWIINKIKDQENQDRDTNELKNDSQITNQ